MRIVSVLVAACFLPAWSAEPEWHIPPVTTRLDVQGQRLEVKVSGTVAAARAGQGQEAIRVKLDANLAELQRNLTAVLAAQLNQSNRCGERMTIERATLAPAAPAGMLTAALRLAADVTSIDATGPVGDLLRSGSLGEAVREKIRATLVAALQKSTDLKAALPAAVQEVAAIRGAEFRDGGEGRLMLAVESEIHMPEEQAAALVEHLTAVDGRRAK